MRRINWLLPAVENRCHWCIICFMRRSFDRRQMIFGALIVSQLYFPILSKRYRSRFSNHLFFPVFIGSEAIAYLRWKGFLLACTLDIRSCLLHVGRANEIYGSFRNRSSPRIIPGTAEWIVNFNFGILSVLFTAIEICKSRWNKLHLASVEHSFIISSTKHLLLRLTHLPNCLHHWLLILQRKSPIIKRLVKLLELVCTVLVIVKF